MKKLILVLIAFALNAGVAPAAENQIGLGLIAGNPSGISAKIATGKMNSIDLILGYNMNRYDDRYPNNDDCCRVGGIVYTSADYVWYDYNLIRICGIRFPIYYGPGFNVIFSHYTSAGIRGVMGLEYQFAKSPFDVFLEIVPGINLAPNTVMGIDGGLGTRYFF